MPINLAGFDGDNGMELGDVFSIIHISYISKVLTLYALEWPKRLPAIHPLVMERVSFNPLSPR